MIVEYTMMNWCSKYGWNNFTHEILAQIETADEADKLEQFYIKKFDTVINGYNIAFGGAGRHTYKPVLQLDLQKNIIAKFDSIVDAELALNIPVYQSHIGECCAGQQRTTKGFCWCYEEDYQNYKIKERKSTKLRTTKEIYQLLRDKTIIAKYPSALAAYKAISNKKNAKHGSQMITECCRGLRSCAYKYFWCYVEDYDTFKIKLSYYQKKVLQIDKKTLKPITLFDNLKQAAKAVGSNGSRIGAVCHNKRKSEKGYIWKFVTVEEEQDFKKEKDLW